MQHSRSDFFNRPLQRPCRDVKFTLALVFNAPCLANGHMTVCRGRVLNRNNRFFQFPVEAVRVQGPENLFQISCRSARSDCLFHCTHSLYHNKKSGLPESRGRFRLPAVRTGHFRLSSWPWNKSSAHTGFMPRKLLDRWIFPVAAVRRTQYSPVWQSSGFRGSGYKKWQFHYNNITALSWILIFKN